jgi:hypothetical protein
MLSLTTTHTVLLIIWEIQKVYSYFTIKTKQIIHTGYSLSTDKEYPVSKGEGEEEGRWFVSTHFITYTYRRR